MSRKFKKQILVVDDDPAIRRMLSRILTGEGYGVSCAADGSEALTTAQAEPPDLVLLDVSLRDKSGWDIFDRLVKIKPLLPVVIITGKANQLFTALSAGAGALFEKPLQLPKLLQAVSQLLAESLENRVARQQGKATDFHFLPA